MDIIRTRQKNWIGRMLRGNSLCTEGDNRRKDGRKDGREERKRKG